MPAVTHDAVQVAAPARARRWWIVLACVGLMFCLPFLAPFKAPPVPSFHAEILAAALGLLAVSLTWIFRRGELPLPLTLVWPALFALILLAQLLAGFLPAQQPALLALLYLLWMAGLVVVGAVLRNVFGLARAATALAWFLVAGGVLSALAGVAQLVSVPWLSNWVMPTGEGVWGNLGQRNHFASYLAIALASLLLLWSTERISALPAMLLGLLLVCMLPLSASRSIWLYAGGFAFLGLLWYVRERGRMQARLAVAAACLVPIMLAAEWLWAMLGVQGIGQTTSLDRLRADASDERSHIWLLAWRMFSGHPLTGVGYNQFGWQYFLLNGYDPRPVEGYTHHAHNLVLHLGAEFGVAGVLALALGGLCWWLAARKLTRTPAAWWLMSVCAVLGIHALLEYPLWYAYFLGIAAVVLGLCGGRTLEFQPTRTMRGLLILCLALGWYVLAQLFRDYVYLENFLAFRYRYIDATAQVNQRAKEMLLDIRKSSLLAPYVELGLARAIEVDRAGLDAKLRVNGHAMRGFPIDDVVYRHAMLLALKGDVGLALRQWDLARASYPYLEPMALAVLRRRAQDLGGGLQPLLKHAESNIRR